MNKLKNMLRTIEPLSAYILKSCLEICVILLLLSTVLILHNNGELTRMYMNYRIAYSFIYMIPLIITESICAALLIDLYAKKC